MLYIISTLLSGIFSALISIGFREYEIRHKTIVFGRQFVLQLVFLLLFLVCASTFFSGYTLQIGNLVTLNWFFLFLLFSTLSYYMMQVLYEWISGGTLFPTDMEVEEFIEEHMNK